MFTRRLAIVAAAALCSCGIPYPSQQNGNNGQGRHLFMERLSRQAELPLGIPTQVIITHRDEGLYECKDWFDFDLLHDGPGIHTNCAFKGTSHAVTELVSAECADAMCTTSIDSATITITPRVEGDVVLTVVARIDDGREITDTFAMSFSKYEPLLIECVQAFSCPGPHAVFVGAMFQLLAESKSSATERSQFQKVVISDVGEPGVISLHVESFAVTHVSIRALKPGTATIRFEDLSDGRHFRIERTVRVVAVEEALGGEVHVRAGSIEANGYTRADVDMVGDPLPAVVDTEALQLVLAWRLADGSLALGGAGRVSASLKKQVIAPTRTRYGDNREPLDEPAARDVDHMLFYVVGGPGKVTLEARLGAATLSQSFEYTFRRPDPVPCAAPVDAYGGYDLTDRGDFLGMSDWYTSGSITVLTGQRVAFAVDAFANDVVLVQRCGPAWAVAGPQSNDFDASFATAGLYQF